MTGRDLSLASARLDVSGATGGGSVRVGGDYQGGGPLSRAQTVTIDAGSTIRADATTSGDGGRVIVWSDGFTGFAGRISAQGGRLGGDGGFAEVSGKATLAFTGSADLRATLGRFGTLLLDPYNVTISNGADANQSGFTATGDNSVINVATLQNQLALSNVTISTGSGGSQAGDITVAAPIVWDSGSTLTLSAYRSIAVNANIFITGPGGLALNTNQGGSGGTLSFAMAAGVNYTGTPHTGQSLSINGQGYQLVYDATELQAINNDLTGRYALAGPINGTPTSGWNGGLGFYALGVDGHGTILNGGNGFTGKFEGLGNVIYNLTAFQVPSNYVGLFGVVGSSGTVSNVGLRNVNIGASDYAGAIAGVNRGTITQSWADGRVQGSSSVGGLVGYNTGTLSRSFSNASVDGRDRNQVGGLVGRNGGTISQAYATGSVIGGRWVGGLVGTNDSGAWIIETYASGATHGSDTVGGLVGINQGTVVASSFVTDTTGRSTGTGSGSAGGTPITLTQFLDGGVGPAFAGGTGGIMPYLANFYPNGAEMVSGTAYTDLGVTRLVSSVPLPIYAANPGRVSTVVEGVEYGKVTTGANGFYATLLPPGTLTPGARVITFTQSDTSPSSSGSTDAVRFERATGASVMAGLDIYGTVLTARTTATTLSQARAEAVDTAGAAGSSPTALAALAGLKGRAYLATGASFTVDQAVNLNGQSLMVQTEAGAPLTVAQPIDVRTGSLLTLKSGGDLAINANVTMYGAGTLSLGNGAGYDYGFRNGASVSFYDAGGSMSDPNPGMGTTWEQLTHQYLFINGAKYWIVYSKFQLDEIDGLYAFNNQPITAYGTGLSGNFAMAYDFNMAGFTYGTALVGRDAGTAFSGTFAGLGHKLSNLSMSSSAANFGLFGYVAGGTIRDVGIASGSVAGGNSTGALIGSISNGQVLNTYSNVQVSGAGSVGGLIGNASNTTILRSMAAGTVVGGTGVGGLVGWHSGTIRDSYATGAVRGSGGVGGLIGLSYGLVERTFATGAVLGDSSTGGLAGAVYGGAISNSFFDIGTTGQTDAAGGVAGGTVSATGMTTTGLQNGGLAALGFDAAVWSGGAGGLYPYLPSFYGRGVQAISGTAYRADGTTGLAPDANGFVTVQLASGGAVRGRAVTGANGYYYIMVDAGTVNGTAVAYLIGNASQGTSDAATVRTGASGRISGLDLQSGWRIVSADATVGSVSAVNATFAAAVSGTSIAGSSFANQRIDSAASSFVVDQPVSQSGIFALSSAGTVTQAAGTITADGLLLGGGGRFTLAQAANQVRVLAADVGALDYVNATDLTIDRIASTGVVVAGVQTTDTVKVAASGALTIASGAGVSGVSPVLAAGGAFVNQAGAGAVTATGGRWLIYSNAPGGNTFGGLDSGNTAIFGASPATLPPGSVSQAGNRYLFASRPTLTFTSINGSKVYGEEGAATIAGLYAVTGYDPGVSGAYRGDDAATAYTGAPALTSAGTGAFVPAGGLGYTVHVAQGTLASPSGYAFSFSSPGILSVTPRPISVTADTKSRVYGDGNPALTYNVSGLLAGDALTGGLETDATSGSGVGTYAIRIGSLGNPNYAISYTGADLTIVARPITVAADAKSRVYGDGNPVLTYSTSGLLPGDALTGGLETDAMSGSGVGTYAIRIGSLGHPNYAISYTGAELAVTARPLTVTADARSRFYGDANPVLTYAAPGLLPGDALTGALEVGATTVSGVGAYAIGRGTLANPNYAISYAGADLTITPRPITVTADARSRVYGDANPALTYQVTGGSLVNGDTLSGGLETAATTTSGVGIYAIARGTLGDPNYKISYAGADLTITARPITVAADARSRVYGDDNPGLTYRLTAGSLVGGDSLAGALETGATTTSGVGAYAITRGTLANPNYAISYTSADLTITARPITLAADAKSRVYGDGNPALTYRVTAGSLVNGDALAGTLETDASQASGVGTYAITRGTLANPNYAISYASADLTITARPVRVTADARSRIYGDANPALTYQAEGLLSGDTLTGALETGAAAASGVGAYAIRLGTLGNPNYAVSYAGADLTITPRAITITAHDQSRVYGEANPALAYAVGGAGLVNGDMLTGALATAATERSGIGGYAITAGTIGGGNYQITGFSGATLTVTARPVTIVARDVTKSFGQPDPPLTWLAAGMGLVNGDQASGALAREAGEAIGSYTIQIGSLAFSPNYQITFQPGRFTVAPSPAAVAISQLASLVAPPPEPSGGTTVLEGLTTADRQGLLTCRPQPAGGLTCP
ncbi:MBG domain-containing protein [Phreatobacter sp. AB_2022a]|uniref:MBG domain-containing protein n=1 Tax=Phreatobacter sp. AB_2022a TaxID=3003134 RepID=UPI0022870811|nr:MBG domain-containing protein [Phreatobacter sp. AB_2022a]MCZ0738611.1 MBG domain-containing protein [Phreatobacter sp. AB_2022a]